MDKAVNTVLPTGNVWFYEKMKLFNVLFSELI